MAQVTADTITDEQIRKLRNDLWAAYWRAELVPLEDRQATYNALTLGGGIVGAESFWSRRQTQEEARARCAEILNAERSAVKHRDADSS
ncbi:MAG: hypothetical protein ACTHU0_18350 [Kofleriaceae bacterium]